MNKLFVYVDPGFIGPLGHYETLATNIHNYCDLNDIEIKHYVYRSCAKSEVERFNLINIFDDIAAINSFIDEKEYKHRINSFNAGIIKICEDISNIHARYDKIDLFLYTGHPYYIQIILTNIIKYKLKKVKLHLTLFYLDEYFCREVKVSSYLHLLEETSNQINRSTQLGYVVNINSDSINTINIYQPYFLNKINLLPIPLHCLPLDNNYRKKTEENCNVLYFGYCTKKHGADLIYKLINNMCFNEINYTLCLKETIHIKN